MAELYSLKTTDSTKRGMIESIKAQFNYFYPEYEVFTEFSVEGSELVDLLLLKNSRILCATKFFSEETPEDYFSRFLTDYMELKEALADYFSESAELSGIEKNKLSVVFFSGNFERFFVESLAQISEIVNDVSLFRVSKIKSLENYGYCVEKIEIPRSVKKQIAVLPKSPADDKVESRPETKTVQQGGGKAKLNEEEIAEFMRLEEQMADFGCFARP